MKTGKLVIAIFFLAGWNSLFAQKNEDYRLQALMFFCQNKNDIFRLDNFEFGSIEPLFVLDLNVNENDTSESFYIDYYTFDPDTFFIENFLYGSQMENVIVNNKAINVSSPLVLSEFCDFVYQSVYMEKCYEPMKNSLCWREFGLSVSNVISYKGLKYVVLRISSYFKAKVDKLQFCLIEFSKEGSFIRCVVGSPWWVD